MPSSRDRNADDIEMVPMRTSQKPTEQSDQTSTTEADNPWKLKVVLTMDGGGVRGYGSLLMLCALMQKVAEKEKEEQRVLGACDSSFAPYAQPAKWTASPAHSVHGEANSMLHMSESTASMSQSAFAPRTPSRAKSTWGFNFGKTVLVEDEDKDEVLKPTSSGYLPCHYFDYIGGTSTGGLNAIMLGRLRMTVEQCIANYPSMASRIFSTPRRSQVKGWPKAKHDAALLKAEIENVVRIRTGPKAKEKWKKFESPEDLCRTLVISKKMDLAKNSEALYIFRSYDNLYKPRQPHLPKNPGLASSDFIWEAGRATSAAPTYFKPMQIGNDLFSDGGFSFNNPTREVHKDVLHKEGFYSTGTNQEPILLILSIGTGGDDSNTPIETVERSGPQHKKKGTIVRHIKKLTEKMQGEVTNTERVDDDMRELSYNRGWTYIRWNGGPDLANIELDEWKPSQGRNDSTKDRIEKLIALYMSDSQRVSEIEKTAELLVNVRRQRIMYEDGDRWHRFTHCSRLICNQCGAKNYKETGTKALLREHIARNHTGREQQFRFPPKVPGGPF